MTIEIALALAALANVFLGYAAIEKAQKLRDSLKDRLRLEKRVDELERALVATRAPNPYRPPLWITREDRVERTVVELIDGKPPRAAESLAELSEAFERYHSKAVEEQGKAGAPSV